MNESSMPPATQRWTHWGCSASATPSDRRNARQVSLWAAGWMAILLPALLVMKVYGQASLLIPSAALLASALAVLPLLRAQLRFLRKATAIAWS